MTGKISAWVGEPDPVLRQALCKLAEEASELAKAALRAAMIGMIADDPDGKPCYEKLNEELSDVNACVAWIHELNGGLIGGVFDREQMKYQGFQHWEALIREYHGKRLEPIKREKLWDLPE